MLLFKNRVTLILHILPLTIDKLHTMLCVCFFKRGVSLKMGTGRS